MSSLHTISNDYQYMTFSMITESWADVEDVLQHGSSETYKPVSSFYSRQRELHCSFRSDIDIFIMRVQHVDELEMDNT